LGFQVAEAAESIEDGISLLRACKGLLNLDVSKAPVQVAEELAHGSYCAGFINGMMDMNSQYQGLVLPPNTGFFCVQKEGLETEQAVRVVVKYMEEHPEQLHLPKRLLVFLALSAAFPCEGNEVPTAATPSSGVNGRWRLLNTDAVRTLRQEGTSISVSGTVLLPDGSVVDTTYDLVKQNDGTYKGLIVARWRCETQTMADATNRSGSIQDCPVEEQIVLTKIEPDRIAGKILHRRVPPRATDEFRTFCKTCGFGIEPEWAPFAWVRSERRGTRTIADVSRVFLRMDTKSASEDPAGVWPVCRAQVEVQIAGKAFKVVSDKSAADAELAVTLTYSSTSSFSRAWRGVTAEEGINLSSVSVIRSLPEGAVLFSFSDETEGTPGEACEEFGSDLASRVARAKARATPTVRK
jgi:hypothetical protein